MRHQLALTLMLLGLVGCSTPQQIEWHERPDRIVIAPSHSLLNVSVRTDTANRTKQPKIDSAKSYAVRTDKRYSLRVVDNAYAAQFKSTWSSQSVYLASSVPPTDNSQGMLWESGEWLLHLEFVGDPPLEPINARFRLRTSLYFLPVHGWPN